jgi:methionyl-tRNA formyltransferase
MGSPEFSVPILNSIISAGHDIIAVYCQPPRPAGRGKKERLTPVHSRALELGLDVRHPINFKSKEAVSDFAALKADIAVVVAYGLILPQEILDSTAHLYYMS